MESALSWIGQIFEFLFKLLPTLIICRTTHEGLKFKTGNKIKIISHSNGIYIPQFKYYILPIGFRRTGIHFYWPVVTEYQLVPIKRQTTNLVPQYLSTSDCKSVGVSGILVYEVYDVERLLTACHQYEDTIRDLALAAIKSVIVKHDLLYLLSHNDELDRELTKVLRSQLKRYGIKTIRCTLSDFTPCEVMAHWGFEVHINNNYSPSKNGEQK